MGGASAIIGSSPRGRGTRLPARRRPGLIRFIPAWAGNTANAHGLRNSNTVHPRVGGEHPWSRERYTIRGRFIPAWAGNTAKSRTQISLTPVHPRVGGEHATSSSSVGPRTGSSPRGRGTLLYSPLSSGRFSVHPRVGGEHSPWGGRRPVIHAGSSPRGRGTRRCVGPGDDLDRFIPAWAGNTSRRGRIRPTPSVHPRVGGEHFRATPLLTTFYGSSPRGRGTRRRARGETALRRFIPAWAGNTSLHYALRLC